MIRLSFVKNQSMLFIDVIYLHRKLYTALGIKGFRMPGTAEPLNHCLSLKEGG